ncbi:uncharacterized protein proser2 [Aplochiton taeniatus]
MTRKPAGPETMNIHSQIDPPLAFSVKRGQPDGAQSNSHSKPSKDNAMHVLSQEEKDCIQFFEETIDSLEAGYEEEDTKKKAVQSTNAMCVDKQPGHHTLAPAPNRSPMVSHSQKPSNPKEQDIIDLVRSGPDLVQTKDKFNPAMPDFQSMRLSPESHFEMKPRRDHMENLPAEYMSPPPPPNFYMGTEESSSSPYGHSPYHPPGCIPTPVLIAQNLAKHQGGEAPNILPSSLLCRRSLDAERPSGNTTGPDHLVKQGPPTSAKPNRFPGNINVMLGSKEQPNQALASVNINDRRAQMLSNLSGTSQPLETEEPQTAMLQRTAHPPTRSVSFRDPTPDKSRMEALSKLGLNRNRAQSGGGSLLHSPPINAKATVDTEASIRPPASVTNPPSNQSSTPKESKPDVTPVPLNSSGWKRARGNPSPPATVMPASYPPPHQPRPVSPPSPEVSSLDFNSYGGKSITLNPLVSSKNDVVDAPSSHVGATPSLSTASDFNSYGGKSKVITPVPVAAPRSDLPDILSSHVEKSRATPPPASNPVRPEAVPHELNNYGGKTRTVTPSLHSTARTSKAPAPAPAPRPPRQHAPPSPQKGLVRAPSPEPRRKSISKPGSFRSQGITVQFSGRGATDASRKEALRALGLLKGNSSF